MCVCECVCEREREREREEKRERERETQWFNTKMTEIVSIFMHEVVDHVDKFWAALQQDPAIFTPLTMAGLGPYTLPPRE